MTVYVVAQLKFKDEPAYRRYQAAAAELFARKRVTVLAADESPLVLEGDSAVDKVVIMAFGDEASARAFLGGPEYEAISNDRRAGADTVAVLVHGL